MKWPFRSIAFPVACLLIVGMFVVMVLSTVLTLGVFLSTNTQSGQRVSTDAFSKLIRSSMDHDSNGRLRLDPKGISTTIMGFAEAEPSFWYLMSDGQETVSHGTIPVSVDAIINAAPSEIFASEFYYTSGGERYLGLRLVDDRNPKVVVAVGGLSLSYAQTIFVALWSVWPQGLYHLLGLVLITTATIAAVIVKRTIAAPVRKVVDSAERIDGLPNGRRIPDGDTPAELRPMVAAFNTALMRIDNAFEAQRNFLASASHELRTPLTKLRIKLDLVKDVEVREMLIRDATRLASIVTTSLQLARLSGQSLAFTSVDLTAIVRSAVADHVPRAIKQGLEIELRAPQAEVVISGSEAAIRVALDNLISNAIHHAQQAETVIVEVLETLTLKVIDHGPGVPAEERDAVLRPFTRGINTVSDGTGMGLAIVAQVMHAHGGSVLLEETPGGGLTVCLIFPPHS
ncbi:hypothetical protein A6U86_29345 [Rhizobium sp. AC27/96]|uniref:sensor histidine kinase n=1 Tax=Rhizobium TaxID=379 RepID=UPI000828E0B9|nr:MULTISPECIES: HAMP domain-containing sensor histidine kinase [Rhizobium]NTF44062.1 HAMP domain-containing histidine kinase [Rhizobium rhizogenes]OCJ05370.1 hypothetical protein A6U86_29345 [Rhizobium sp. AC27/96]